MSRRHATGRHRSAGRAKTPLTGITAAVTANAGVLGRRSAVFAASSGLAMTMGATPASAEKSTEIKISHVVTPEEATPEQTGAPKAAVKAVVTTPAPEKTTEVAVPAEVIVNLQEATVTKATPPPAPVVTTPVAAAPETARGRDRQRPTRSNERTAAPRPAAQRPAAETPAQAKPAKKPAAKKPAAEKPAVKSPGKTRAAVLSIAARYVGVPYRWGGTTPKGFDCSGYVQYVFKQVGVSLPRTSGAQARAGKRVSAAQARPGDLVWKPGHIGIYAGNGMMYDAPRRGKNVIKRKIYFKPVYVRVLN